MFRFRQDTQLESPSGHTKSIFKAFWRECRYHLSFYSCAAFELPVCIMFRKWDIIFVLHKRPGTCSSRIFYPSLQRHVLNVNDQMIPLRAWGWSDWHKQARRIGLMPSTKTLSIPTGGRGSMHPAVAGPVAAWKHDWFCGQSCLYLILTDPSWSLIDFLKTGLLRYSSYNIKTHWFTSYDLVVFSIFTEFAIITMN